MIAEYVEDALIGEDRPFAEPLVTWRAPLKFWLRYYRYRLLWRVGALHSTIQVFSCWLFATFVEINIFSRLRCRIALTRFLAQQHLITSTR